MKSMVVTAFVGSLFAVVALCDRTEASDLSTCANMKNDAERLKCYDVLAKETQREEADEHSTEQSNEAAERERIISRCREEMGEYGSAMVKYCAEEDIAAYRALRGYAAEFHQFVERCEREMGPYGWSMVKYCADEDINAERALNDLIAD